VAPPRWCLFLFLTETPRSFKRRRVHRYPSGHKSHTHSLSLSLTLSLSLSLSLTTSVGSRKPPTQANTHSLIHSTRSPKHSTHTSTRVGSREVRTESPNRTYIRAIRSGSFLGRKRLLADITNRTQWKKQVHEAQHIPQREHT
jgi:hypothetical protein